MKKYPLLTFFLIGFGCICLAQKPLYTIRLDAFIGGSLDRYQLSDLGGAIDNSSSGILSGGIEVDVEYTDYFSIGGGLIFKSYAEELNFKSQIVGTSGQALSSLQIPIYLRTRTYFLKNNASMSALGGGALGLNLDYRTGPYFSNGTYSVSGTQIVASTATDVNLKKAFPLLLLGAGVEFPLLIKNNSTRLDDLRLGFSARRFFGFSDIMQVDINYSIDGGSNSVAEERFQGGYWMFNMHLLFVFNTGK